MSAASSARTLAERPAIAAARAGHSRPAVFVSTVWLVLIVELSWAIAGVTLAMVGVFSLLTVLPTTGLLALGLWRMSASARRAARTPVDRRTAAVRLAALTVVAVAVVVNGALPGEHLQTGRDGGTYTATAGWIAANGNLLIDAEVAPFDDADDLGFEAAGFHAVVVDGPIYAQFMHAFPAMMATVDLAGGLDAMVRTNALLGGVALLMVYAFAERLMRPWAALVVQIALGCNLVFVYFTRAPFSELLTMGVIFGGLWALDQAVAERDRVTALLAGLVLGATFLARLDGLVVLLMLVLALLPPMVSGRLRRVAPAVVVGIVAVVIVALIDLFVFSPFYVELHVEFLVPLGQGFLAVAGLAAVAMTPPGRAIVRTVLRYRRPIAWGLATLIVVAGAFAYVVRPAFEVASWDRTTPIRGIQLQEGQPVNEARTYAEQSARWLGWYLGLPALGIGVVGWAGLVRGALARRRAALTPFLLIVSGLTTLYVWQPTITPDHMWADRRFLPVVIPGLLLFAGWLLDRLWRVDRRAVRVAVAVGAIVVAVAPLGRTGALVDLHEQAGLAADVAQACALLGDDAALLVLDEAGSDMHYRVTQPLRSHCGVPAAFVKPDVTDERIVELARKSPDRQLWVLASREQSLVDRPVDDPIVLLRHRSSRLEATLTRPPRDLDRYGLDVLAAPVTPTPTT